MLQISIYLGPFIVFACCATAIIATFWRKECWNRIVEFFGAIFVAFGLILFKVGDKIFNKEQK